MKTETQYTITFSSRREAAMAIHAKEMHAALFELKCNFRKKVEWATDDVTDSEKAVELVLDLLWQEIGDLPIEVIDEIQD